MRNSQNSQERTFYVSCVKRKRQRCDYNESVHHLLGRMRNLTGGDGVGAKASESAPLMLSSVVLLLKLRPVR